MSETARKFEQVSGTQADEAPQTEIQREKERRKYEEFWDKERERDEFRYFHNWSPEYRKAYVEQGVEFLVDAHEKGTETMVFMDRSARPLAGFFRALWRRIYPDENPPAMKFTVGQRYLHNDPFRLIERHKKARQTRDIYPKEDFDGKTVLIVDEVVASGKTLQTAQKILRQAFPKIRKIILGGMSGQSPLGREDEIIGPVFGSFYSETRASLGDQLYGQTTHHEEQKDSMLTKRGQNIDRTKTWSYKLRQVGRYETLDEKSLQSLDPLMTDQERLRKIREAYKKLLE